jgi:6-pyruvoyltetrahydropterin/6-carboxytetrahydropterin synthase
MVILDKKEKNMFTIRKTFKFEMAHILGQSYSKECQCLHGHSYKMEVIIKALGLNSDGMVIDFKKLKEEVDFRLLGRIDHKCMLQDDHYNIYGGSPRPDFVFVSYNPTAENMVKDFYETLKPYICSEVASFVSLTIRLHETDTGYAEYTEE